MERQTLSEEGLDLLLSRIGRTQPVDPSVADDERVSVALADMLRSIESGGPASSGSGEPTSLRFGQPALRRAMPWGRVRRRRWVTVGVTVVVAGLASLVGVESFGAGGGGAGLSLPLAVSPAAAAQLNRAARAAAGQPTPGDGQWQYQDVRLEGLQHITLPDGPTLAYTTVDTQTDVVFAEYWSFQGAANARWQSHSRRCRTGRRYLANQSAFDAAIDAKDPQYPATKAGLQMDQIQKGSGSPAVYETSPPSDPQTLLAELWQRDLASLGIKSAANVKAYLGHKNDDLWMALGDLLNSPIARLLATAYAALSYVPGSKVVGNATDELGRTGIAVSWMPPFPGNGFTYIISPTTGNLLETDLIQGHTYGGDQAGTAVICWVYQQTRVVDSETAIPGGGNEPISANTQTR